MKAFHKSLPFHKICNNNSPSINTTDYYNEYKHTVHILVVVGSTPATSGQHFKVGC